MAARTSFIQDTRSNTPDDVTLVTFGTMNRITSFERTRKRWRGPITLAIAVYTHTPALKQEAERAVQALKRQAYFNTLVR